jgi:hypothetical protein
MFGISPEAATMADCYAGLHPDDREVTAASYAAAADPARRALYDIESAVNNAISACGELR